MWAINGGWKDATSNTYPDWLEVDFNGTRSIDEIDVYTVLDDYSSTVEPTLSTTFTVYGITAFDVQYWSGSGWVTVPNGSLANNNKVWTRFNFSPISTAKIRVVVNAALLNNSRIVALETWGGGVTSASLLSNDGNESNAATLYEGLSISISALLKPLAELI